MIGRLAHFSHQPLDLGNICAVSGHGDGLRAGTFVGEGIEGFAGRGAGRGFAGGYVDLGAASLEETVQGILLVEKGKGEWVKVRGRKKYPDAAWRPRPREPPVTTATLPSREKMEGKSFRVVWAFASAAMTRGITTVQPELLEDN